MNLKSKFCGVILLLLSSLIHFFSCSTENNKYEAKTELKIGIENIKLGELLRGGSWAKWKNEPTEKIKKLPILNSKVKYSYIYYNCPGLEDKYFSIITEWPITRESFAVIDKNNNEDLSDDPKLQWSINHNSRKINFSFQLAIDDTIYDRQKMHYRVIQDMEFGPGIFAYNNSYRAGEVSIEGFKYQFALYDANYNGLYNDFSKDVILIDLNKNGINGEPLETIMPFDYYVLNQSFVINNINSYMINWISPAGDIIKFKKSKTPAEIRYEIEPGKKAPNFSFHKSDSSLIELDNFRGKVVLLNFWASWCSPCRKEMPEIRNIYNLYKDNYFQIIGINLDNDTKLYNDFLENNPIFWPDFHEGKRWDSRIVKMFRLFGIPLNFVIDQDGIIRYVGADIEKIKEKIQELLKN